MTEPSPLTSLLTRRWLPTRAPRSNTMPPDRCPDGRQPRAVHYWAINANILRNKVKAAMNDWVTNGYKNEYEQIAAFIDQVRQRDMTLLKQHYLDDLEKAGSLASRPAATSSSPRLFPATSPTAVGPSSASRPATSKPFLVQLQQARWQAGGGGLFLGILAAAALAASTVTAEYNGTFDSDQSP